MYKFIERLFKRYKSCYIKDKMSDFCLGILPTYCRQNVPKVSQSKDL